MAATLPTEAQIEQLAIGYLQIAHTDPVTGRAPPVGPRSFLGQQARALAQLVGEILAGVKSADDDAVPSTYTDAQGVTRTRNSGLSLDDWAFVIGLPTNATDRPFGRRVAQAARNGAGTAVYSTGVTLATDAELTDLAGSVTVKLRAGFTAASAGSRSVILDAVTAGEAGNLPIGTVLRWSLPPAGLAATLTLTTALSDGFEIESDVDLALRIVRRLQNFPKGGTAADYREWAESAEDGSGLLVGVVRAYVFKGREGHGSATIVPTLGGSGRARDPYNTAPAKITQIQAWIDGLHIASDTAYVVRPRFVTGEELTIAATVVAAPDSGFDWLGEGTLTVVSVATLALRVAESSLPASLKAAVDNGDKPRVAIQLDSSPLPTVVRVTAYAENSPSGDSTLTLEEELPSAPAGGEMVYEAGGATLPVAAAILDYVDNVGPSRKSGYADPLDPWEDSVSIGRIAQVTLNARDADSGDRVCVWSPDVGNGVGVTIAVGAGSAAGDDFELYDNVPGEGPQLPECAAIYVRRASP